MNVLCSGRAPWPLNERTLFPLCSFAVLIVFGVMSLPYAGAGADDVWIMLYAGETIGQATWFTNHNGLAQEVSSSVLGALLASLASWVVSPGNEYASWKILSWIPAIVASAVLFHALLNRVGWRGTLYSMLALICIPQWHYWAWGGLENGIFALLSLLYVLALARYVGDAGFANSLSVAVLAVALPLTRSDAIWAPLLLLCAAFSIRTKSLTKSIYPVCASIVALLVFHGVRHAFTGHWFPSPTYAKANFSLENVLYGLDYLFQFHSSSLLHLLLLFAIPLAVFLSLQLCVFILRGKMPTLVHWVASMVVLLDLSTILVGGDWMSYHRFATRSILLKILLLGLYVPCVLEWIGRTCSDAARYLKPLLAFFLLGVAASGLTADGMVERHGHYQFGSAIVQEPSPSVGMSSLFKNRNIPYYRDEILLKEWLTQGLPRLVERMRSEQSSPLIIASYQAGYFPYQLRKRFSPDEVYFIDIAGITDTRLGALPGPRTPLGLREGTHDWASSIASHTGALGDLLRSCQPDVVYVLHASAQEQALMREAGYRLEYKRVIQLNGGVHGAFIFIRKRLPQEQACNLLS